MNATTDKKIISTTDESLNPQYYSIFKHMPNIYIHILEVLLSLKIPHQLVIIISFMLM